MYSENNKTQEYKMKDYIHQGKWKEEEEISFMNKINDWLGEESSRILPLHFSDSAILGFQ